MIIEATLFTRSHMHSNYFHGTFQMNATFSITTRKYSHPNTLTHTNTRNHSDEKSRTRKKAEEEEHCYECKTSEQEIQVGIISIFNVLETNNIHKYIQQKRKGSKMKKHTEEKNT